MEIDKKIKDIFLHKLCEGGWGDIIYPKKLQQFQKWIDSRKDQTAVRVAFTFFDPNKKEEYQAIVVCKPDLKDGKISTLDLIFPRDNQFSFSPEDYNFVGAGKK